MVDVDAILSDENYWTKIGEASAERAEKLRSFGSNARGVFVKCEEGLFIVDPEDVYVSHALLTEGFYNREELELAQSFLTKESDVLVVGAHIGTHAIALSRSSRNLVAIEANPNSFELLKANVLLNECKNIEIHQCAAAEEEKRISFLVGRANSGGSKRGPLKKELAAYVYDQPETIEIEAKPLDDLLGVRQFDLVLMDIEGSEYFALQGMPKLLENTKILSMEFLPHMMRNVADITSDKLYDLLLPHFDWMYLPRNNAVVPKEAIPDAMTAMYDTNTSYDNLYFLRDPLPERLRPTGIIQPE